MPAILSLSGAELILSIRIMKMKKVRKNAGFDDFYLFVVMIETSVANAKVKFINFLK